MRVFKQLFFGSCIFTMLFMLTPAARATVWDQRVVATFNAPVEIPGQILPRGTYTFKVVNVVGTRDIVQVSNADESEVLATAITVTRYRSNPTDKPVFEFEEQGSNSPQAIQAWFYPGYKGGHQFIYSARVTPEALTANSTAAPTVPNEAAANSPNATEESSPLMSAEADMSEPTPEVMPESTQSTDQNQIAQLQTTPDTSTTSGTSTDQTDKELPKTASTTPLIALLGMLLLGGAVGLKALASRVS